MTVQSSKRLPQSPQPVGPTLVDRLVQPALGGDVRTAAGGGPPLVLLPVSVPSFGN